MSLSFDSPYYPYEKVQRGYIGMRGSEKIPYKVLNYLLDLPDKNGYQPVDDNNRPRVRLAKYLWHEGANPLGKALPTAQQKLGMVFDGELPVLDTDELKKKHPKGYRIFPQKLWLPSQTAAQIMLKCYTGRISYRDEYHAVIGLMFEAWVNTNLANNTRTDAYDRAVDMEQAVTESLHGVNVGGIGVVSAARMLNQDNGSNIVYDETGTNIGRRFGFSIEWAESGVDAAVDGWC